MQGDAPRILPAASLAAGDPAGALREVRWAADHGFRAVCLGNSPIYGPKRFGKLEYNDPSFEPLWSLLEETGPGRHVPRLDRPRPARGRRQRRRDHQLRLPLDGDHASSRSCS